MRRAGVPLAAIAAAGIVASGAPAASAAAPPLLRASSSTDHTIAALGGYCWSGTCVEATGDPIDRDTLTARAGEVLRLDFRAVATAVGVRPLRARGPADGLPGGPRRRWSLRVTPQLLRARRLLLHVTYPGTGDEATFGITIAARKG